MGASSFSLILADDEEEVLRTSASRKGPPVAEREFPLRHVEPALHEIQMSSQHGDEAIFVVRRRMLGMNKVREALNENNPFARVPKSRRRIPWVANRTAHHVLDDQGFDIRVFKSTLLVQKNSKIPEGGSIFLKEGVRFVRQLPNELPNLLSLGQQGKEVDRIVRMEVLGTTLMELLRRVRAGNADGIHLHEFVHKFAEVNGRVSPTTGSTPPLIGFPLKAPKGSRFGTHESSFHLGVGASEVEIPAVGMKA